MNEQEFLDELQEALGGAGDRLGNEAYAEIPLARNVRAKLYEAEELVAILAQELVERKGVAA